MLHHLKSEDRRALIATIVIGSGIAIHAGLTVSIGMHPAEAMWWAIIGALAVWGAIYARQLFSN
jgi:hypothetical protein